METFADHALSILSIVGCQVQEQEQIIVGCQVQEQEQIVCCGFACSDTKCTPLEGGWVHSPNALKCPVPGCDVLSHHLCSIEHYNAHHGHADCTGDGAYAVRCLKHCTECQREMEEEASKKY